MSYFPTEMTEPTVPVVEPLALQFTLRVVTSKLAEDWSQPPGSDGTQIGALERLDLAELSAAALPDLNLSQELARLSHMHRGEEQARVAKAEGAHFQNRDRGMRRPYSKSCLVSLTVVVIILPHMLILKTVYLVYI
jgi:hypothetical protein